MKILIATKNPGKAREIKSFFEGSTNWRIQIVSLADLPAQAGFPDAPDIEETGKTFEENAVLKAKKYFEWSGIPAVADDAGLEIDYLNGEPGYSRADGPPSLKLRRAGLDERKLTRS